eukprot:6482800-Amphidinium_carterae.1
MVSDVVALLVLWTVWHVDVELGVDGRVREVGELVLDEEGVLCRIGQEDHVNRDAAANRQVRNMAAVGFAWRRNFYELKHLRILSLGACEKSSRWKPIRLR